MWLQDAYAMEQEAETMLKAMAGRLEHYPELRARIQAHVEETRQQSSQLETCIARLDGSVPAARGMLAEEEAMAKWLLEHHESVILAFLTRETTEGVTAKR